MYTSRNLADSFTDLDTLLDHMEAKWVESGGGEGLKTALYEKAVLCHEGARVQGRFLICDSQPVGFYWVELLTNHYGNIVLHCIDDQHNHYLADLVLEQGAFFDKLLEVVIVDLQSPILEQFRKAGCIENNRRRMSYWLEGTPHYPTLFKDVEFRELTEEDKHFTSTLSYTCHQISRDYDMYPEMTIFEKRQKLEDYLFSERYGPVISKGSLIASVNGVQLGYIVNVEVTCWGFEKMPWIFDICVKPDFHGKGLGRALIHESVNRLIDMKYPVIGLAATESNPAIHLYEKVGFQYVDSFQEFIFPKTPELYPRLVLNKDVS